MINFDFKYDLSREPDKSIYLSKKTYFDVEMILSLRLDST